MMKKMVCLCLVLMLFFVFCSCDAKMTAAENYLIAVKQLDEKGIQSSLIMSDEALQRCFDHIGEEEKTALSELYALTVYDIGETKTASGSKYVEVSVKLPDMEKILSLAKMQILVTAESAEQVVHTMLADGTIAKTMMKQSDFYVKMTENADGEFLIDRNDEENKAFFDAIALENMMTFFLNH